MKHSRLKQGFTLVELLIVLIVITILVTITATIYKNVQVQAQDVARRSAADKIRDAATLYFKDNPSFPKGNYTSVTTLDANGNCTDGLGTGWIGKGAYGVNSCSFEEMLIARGLIPSDLIASTPVNQNLSNKGAKYSYMLYQGLSSKQNTHVLVEYTLEDPSAADTAHFNAQLTLCGYDPSAAHSPRDQWGMRDAFCINYK